ncbi:hypothetical protein CHARACLAT_010950 [Characodon lateralis]|uniref:Uncharacterized protein n=1 Tax=Characodon lateralis TaxID=208331 RepID=A0ABU7DG34_9TELE|nr:hypothetical protein [Characodon lateralis]
MLYSPLLYLHIPLTHIDSLYSTHDSTTPPQGPGRGRRADHSVGIFPASRREVRLPGETSFGVAVTILGHQTGGASPRDRSVTLRVSACLLRQPQAATEE